MWLCVATAYNATAATISVRDTSGVPVENAVVVVLGQRVDAIAETRVMDQVNKQFLPYVLIVQAGDAVKFPNSDNIRHHVYSFSPIRPFEIKLYSGVPGKSIVFDKPGVAVLGCNIHDSMIGYIFVADHQLAVNTDAGGEVVLPDNLNAGELMVWHPRLQQGVDNPVRVAGFDGKTSLTVSLALTPVIPQRKKGFGNRL
jgi:plastocyanin